MRQATGHRKVHENRNVAIENFWSLSIFTCQFEIFYFYLQITTNLCNLRRIYSFLLNKNIKNKVLHNYYTFYPMRTILVAIISIFAIGFCHARELPSSRYVTYKHFSNSDNSIAPVQSFPAKAARSSSNAGKINLIFNENVADSMRVAMTAAAEVWENALCNRQPIYISIEMEELEDGLAMIEFVEYLEEADGCPTSLYSHLTDLSYGAEDSLNGILILNENENWNCSFSDEKVSGNNVYTEMMRAVAICLGFGSSLKESDDEKKEVIFQQDFTCPFDRIIETSNGTKMVDAAEESDDIRNFIENNSFYALAEDGQKFSLYNPRPYENAKSLVYLDEPTSLMHYDVGSGDKFFEIDNTTKLLLNAIGWDFEIKQPVKIICDNIGEDGIGSSYNTHTFSVDGLNGASDPRWEFRLFDLDETPILINYGNGKSFSISPVKDNGQYFKRSDGDIVGEVTCSYPEAGSTKELRFRVYLETNPIIISIDNLQKHRYDKDHFYLTFTVTYAGANRIATAIEEEYSDNITYHDYLEPYIAHITTAPLIDYLYSWVDIIVTNEYGKDVRTLEYPAEYPTEEEETGIPEIANFNYDYTLTPDSSGSYSIKGYVSFDVKVAGHKRIVINCSSLRHNGKPLWTAKRSVDYEVGQELVHIDYDRLMDEKAMFRLQYFASPDDESWTQTSPISVIDYIAPEDLSLLTSSVSGIEKDGSCIISDIDGKIAIDSLSDPIVAVVISNISGQTVYQDSREESGKTIDKDLFPNGIYLIQVRTASGFSTVRKFIKK